MGTSRIRTVPTTVVGLPLLVLALLFLLALPGAATALPPEYGWAWAQPFVWQPPAGTTDTIQEFKALAAGPSGSVYASVTDSTGTWAIARVAAADGSGLWTTPALKGPSGKGARLAALTSDAKRNAIGVGLDQAHNGDVLVVKVNPGGTILWQETWDGPAHSADGAKAVAVDRSGNIYVAGFTDRGSSGHYDALVLKYSPKGALLWKYLYKTPLWDTFKSIGVDAKGNVYVSGDVGQNYDVGSIATLRLSPLGKRVWMRKVAGYGVHYTAYRLKVKGSGIYVTGFLFSPDTHPVAFKYSLAGKQIWAFGDSMDVPVTSPAGMDVDPAGRLVLAFNSQGLIAADRDLLAVKVLVLTPGGTLYREAVIDGTFDPGTPREALGLDLAIDAGGRIYCCGSIDTAAYGASTNSAVTSFPPAGTPGWSAADRIWRYDSPGDGTYDRFWGLLALGGGQMYAAGSRDKPGSSPARMEPIVLRLGPDALR